jgi:hypothetical protein
MPFVICEACKLDHPPMTPCGDAQAAAMAALLLRCGRIDRCDCGETIYWMRHLSGNTAPYTKQGLVHFKNCTGKFSKGAKP